MVTRAHSIGIMRKVRASIAILFVMCLVACGNGGDQVTLPVQHWKDINVRVETHPNPPLEGMSEIVVIATGPHGMPVQDLMVSLRGNESMPWVQAIQDGLIGVYRRATDLGDAESTVLLVRLQHGSDETTLRFPLKLAAG
jgi:hypothetical protein